MLQIVHDIAPGAALAFDTAFGGEAAYANAVLALAQAGATVIVDDAFYVTEPFFQDGLIAQAVETVHAQGVAYFTAAGNKRAHSYEIRAPSFPVTASAGQPNAGEQLLNFDGSGLSTTTAMTLQVSVTSTPENNSPWFCNGMIRS